MVSSKYIKKIYILDSMRYIETKTNFKTQEVGAFSMDFFVKQLSASFILDSLLDRVHTFSEKEQEKIWKFYRHFSDFEMITNFEGSPLAQNSSLRLSCLVAQNIIRRGIPTRAPKRVENFFRNIDLNVEDLAVDTLLQHISILDPDFNFNTEAVHYHKTEEGTLKVASMNFVEREFLHRLPSKLGQLLEYQKSIESIIDFPNTDISKYPDYTKYCLNYTKDKLKGVFKGQDIDFTFQFPADQSMKSAVAIELDGPQHEEFHQRERDRYRDTLLEELYWEKTIRIEDIYARTERLESLLNRVPDPVPVESNMAYIVRYPMFVARMALSILNLIESGHLNINVPKLSILAECDTKLDFEATKMGIKVAYDMIEHITNLQGRKRELPIVYLEGVMGNHIWEESILPRGKQDSEGKGRIKYQVILNVAMHKRLSSFAPIASDGKKVWILSSYSHAHFPKVLTSERQISYKLSPDNDESLRYFLYDIFRKVDFRPKQREIIGEALSRNNVIGLLPTGSGKTLTFQLSALLQPGITIVIAPLISLMADQLHNLKQQRIDSCALLNSTLQSHQKLKAIEEFENEGIHILYVAPERLLIHNFKESLRRIKLSMAVLDEAHCISQWGHDFRTSYLYVGEILQNENKDIVIMALTGTASCNVITDIKRELHFKRTVTIVTPNHFRRDELNFKVVYGERDKPLSERIQGAYLTNQIGKAIQHLYDYKDVNYATEMIELFSKKNKWKQYINGGLIFVPYAQKRAASVQTAVESLRQYFARYHNEAYKDINFGLYHGSLKDKEKNEQQNKFTRNETLFLVATKAFGMGIDKPNIRFTMHTTIPESIEAFYQEAGRAGRDREKAVNIILAPPKNMSFEEIEDAKIYEFFINQSFPELELFLKEVDIVFNTPYIGVVSFRTYLEAGFSELDFDFRKKVRFTFENNAELVYAHITVGDYTFQYELNITDTECLFTPIDTCTDADTTVRLCADAIVAHLKKKIENISIITSTKTFNRAICRCKSEMKQSLAEVVQQINEGNSIEFYVGLDEFNIKNKVTEILRHLEEKKQEQLVFDLHESDEIHRIIKALHRSNANINEELKRFKPIVDSICSRNALPILSASEYRDLFFVHEENSRKTLTKTEEKVLYYLSRLKIFDSLERAYSPNYMKVRLRPFNKESLIQGIKEFLNSYETYTYVVQKIKEVEKIFADIPDTAYSKMLEVAVKYIIRYSYQQIRAYREMQTRTMYQCLQSGDERNPEVFVDEVYRYFESKYTDMLLKEVDRENVKTMEEWADKIELEAKEQSQAHMNNLSHLRTSCLKVMESRPQAFTPLFLYAYGTLQDTNLDITVGLEYFIKGVTQIAKVRKNYKSYLRSFCYKMMNTTDIEYLQEVIRKIDQYNDEELEILKEVVVEQIGKL